MSLDQVDDLEAAEDAIAALTAQMRRVQDFQESNPWTGLLDGPAELRDGITLAWATGAAYCRPSCGMHGTPHVGPIEGWVLVDDGCGCPCHTRA